MDEINSIGKDKGSKILRNGIIIMTVLIIFILLLFVFLYFCTDTLKTNKQLFFKYASQLIETEGAKSENNIQAFYNKKQEMPYENEGKFDFTIDLEEETNEQIDIANDFVINFSGKNDKANKKAEQNIELKYSDDVSWPLIYRQDGDVYGIQTDYVSSQYVAVENNNLKEFAEKIGISDTSNIPDKIEFTKEMANIEYSPEELKEIKERYVSILENQLREDQFQNKKNEDGLISYILTMTNEELKNLLIAILNELKTDEVVLNKINDILLKINTESEDNMLETEDIEAIIQDLQKLETEEGQMQLIVTKKDSSLISMEFEQNDNIIQLTKNDQGDNVNYTITVNVKLSAIDKIGAKIYFSVAYSGLNELNNVKENYELGIEALTNDEEQVGKYTYQFENTVNFVDSIDIEGLNEENAMILNNYESEQIQNFIGQLTQRIVDVNTEQMQSIGFEYGNPMILMIPTTLENVLLTSNVNEVIVESDISETEKRTSNEIVLKYEGDVKGSMVKSLLSEVSRSNNNNDNESQVIVEFAGIGLIKNEELSLARDYVVMTNTYNVSVEYDDNHRVNKVIITGEFEGLSNNNNTSE